MLNSINTPIAKLHAVIANAVLDNVDCTTPEMERAYMVASGKAQVYTQQLVTRLTGNLIARVSMPLIEDETVRVYLQGSKKRYFQSLNDSLLMVGFHSVLLSGFTNSAIVGKAIENWLFNDKIKTEQTLDVLAIAEQFISQLITDNILEKEEDTAQMDEGGYYKAHSLTKDLLELRVNTMIILWEQATPKMKPMRFPLTWQLDGTCELENFTFKEQVKQPFIDALNRMGHTQFKINPVIRAMVKRKLNKGGYTTTEQKREMNALIKLKTNDCYYLPHTPDYRGRVYPRGGLTTPAGCKDMRAAFDFMEYTKVDEYGLFLHVANAHGFDKISITDRLQWVKDNHIALMTTPSKTLYAERSRLAYIEYKETGISNIIARIDGTVSGVQITSGLFLDAKTGAAVNVSASSPDDKPKDLYGMVATKAIKLSNRGISKSLLEKYGRSLTKQPIMILAYGAGENKLIDSIKLFLAENEEKTTAARDLYKVIMQAIAKEFPAITRLNEQLQRELVESPLTKLVYKLSDMTVKIKPLNTDALKMVGNDYSCTLQGKGLPDSAALARGISPNIVHSFDSELLRKAVNIIDTDVSCIHDDIGVQTNQVRKALQAVRTAYVEVIKAEPLKQVYIGMDIEEEYWKDDNGLNLNDVLESTYLFS